jgi:hypothetical protein
MSNLSLIYWKLMGALIVLVRTNAKLFPLKWISLCKFIKYLPINCNIYLKEYMMLNNYLLILKLMVE